MRRARLWAIAVFLSISAGCAPLGPKLTFPTSPIKATDADTWYDVNRDGRGDFALHLGEDGRVESLFYDDDQDGAPDRVYRLDDYRDADVPHLVILLDSLPFEVMAERYARGDFRWFAEPVKVVPVFPTLTELCYTRLLGAAPLAGMTDEYFDENTNTIHGGFWARSWGEREPWERRLDYHAPYFEASHTYLSPRSWLPIEMGRIREALNRNPKRVTVVYVVTASAMACKLGRPGMEETLDAARQLCLQLLYERRGAIKISMMADHGHNLVSSRSASASLERALTSSGFRVGNSMPSDRDVVIELAALVNYVGIHTRQSERVADACVRAPEVELAVYLEQSHVIVRDAIGAAAIDHREGAFRYRVIDRDVLGYEAVVANLRRAGKLSSDGWAADRDWFDATVDHRYPDAPLRLWDAFHGLVVAPPEVMVTLKAGWHAGKQSLDRWITMRSTHGSLDRMNSVTFLATMSANNLPRALRGDDVMRLIEPTWHNRAESTPSADSATIRQGEETAWTR